MLRHMQKQASKSIVLSPCQIVSLNVEQARRLRGWSQALMAEKLEPYIGYRLSRAAISKAERTIRRWDADEIVAVARVFELPISYFFEPPEPHYRGKQVVVNSKPGRPDARVTARPLRRDELMRLAAYSQLPSGPLDQRQVVAALAAYQAAVTHRAVLDFLRERPERLPEIVKGQKTPELAEYLQRAAAAVTGPEEERFAQAMLKREGT
jgi:hypothetical protein